MGKESKLTKPRECQTCHTTLCLTARELKAHAKECRGES